MRPSSCGTHKKKPNAKTKVGHFSGEHKIFSFSFLFKLLGRMGFGPRSMYPCGHTQVQLFNFFSEAERKVLE